MNFESLDRARTDIETEGRAKVITDLKGRILGAHFLGANAGDLIHEAQILKTLNIKISKIKSVIHVYPSFADITRKLGKADYLERVNRSKIVKFLKWLFIPKK